MIFLYSVGIRVYGIIVLISSLFYDKAAQWIQGRKSQFVIIEEKVSKWNDAPSVMIHASSYGEYEMSKPIIENLKSKIDNLKIIISFFSPSGYTNVNFENPDFLKIYMPLDTKSNQKKLINIIDPDAVIFIKYDFWFNLLSVLSENKTPYYFTSLHLNQDSYLFKKVAHPFLNLIKKAKIIFAHNLLSKDILQSHGINNVKVIGDTRVDKAIENKKVEYNNIKVSNPERKLIIIGSLTDEDIDMVTSYINTHSEYNYIIAPHDIFDSYIDKITNKLNRHYAYYTEGKKSNIIIINTLGDLKYLYRYADIAYIGGGFSKGPHNVIEPLVYGVKVFCGPNIEKFPMSINLVKNELLYIINNKRDFITAIEKLEDMETAGYKSKCHNFISNNKSQLNLLTKDILELINEK